MKKCITYIACLFLGIIGMISCDKDYLIDGGVSNAEVNMTTYDFLVSRPLFDTLVMAIDKAGLKEKINGETTLFATTNFSFKNYIDLMTTRGRTLYNDPNYLYLFDSIPTQVLKDSLAMYIFQGKIQRDNMTKEGEVRKNLAGTELKISLEPRDEYGNVLTNAPTYVYLTYKRGAIWDEWDAENVATKEQDTKIRVQTSGLITTNGIVHVLENGHTLFFDRN